MEHSPKVKELHRIDVACFPLFRVLAFCRQNNQRLRSCVKELGDYTDCYILEMEKSAIPEISKQYAKVLKENKEGYMDKIEQVEQESNNVTIERDRRCEASGHILKYLLDANWLDFPQSQKTVFVHFKEAVKCNLSEDKREKWANCFDSGTMDERFYSAVEISRLTARCNKEVEE